MRKKDIDKVVKQKGQDADHKCKCERSGRVSLRETYLQGTEKPAHGGHPPEKAYHSVVDRILEVGIVQMHPEIQSFLVSHLLSINFHPIIAFDIFGDSSSVIAGAETKPRMAFENSNSCSEIDGTPVGFENPFGHATAYRKHDSECHGNPDS